MCLHKCLTIYIKFMKYIKLLNPLLVLYVCFFTVSKHLSWHPIVPAIEYFTSTSVRTSVYWKIKPLATVSELANQMWHTDTAQRLTVIFQHFSCCLGCVSFEGGGLNMSVPDTSFSDLNEEDPGFCLPQLKLKQTWSISAHRQSSAWITHAHTPTPLRQGKSYVL